MTDDTLQVTCDRFFNYLFLLTAPVGRFIVSRLRDCLKIRTTLTKSSTFRLSGVRKGNMCRLASPCVQDPSLGILMVLTRLVEKFSHPVPDPLRFD